MVYLVVFNRLPSGWAKDIFKIEGFGDSKNGQKMVHFLDIFGIPKNVQILKNPRNKHEKMTKIVYFLRFLLQLLILRIDLCIDTRILVMFRGVDKNHQKYRSFSPKRWQISAKKHFYLDMLNGGYPLGNHLLDRIS